MDPNETLRLMQQAIEQEEWENLRCRASDLNIWLRHGGFQPKWEACREAYAYYLGRYGRHWEKNA